jgi:hypothetical protein
MLYIMRNYQIEPGKFIYNLYDSDEKIKCYMNVTPEKAEAFKKQFNMQNISPLDAMSMFDYQKVELGMFIPLPF